VLVATHDREMVDKMRRRVIELSQGRVVRDQRGGFYRTDGTTEFHLTAREQQANGAR